MSTDNQDQALETAAEIFMRKAEIKILPPLLSETVAISENEGASQAFKKNLINLLKTNSPLLAQLKNLEIRPLDNESLPDYYVRILSVLKDPQQLAALPQQEATRAQKESQQTNNTQALANEIKANIKAITKFLSDQPLTKAKRIFFKRTPASSQQERERFLRARIDELEHLSYALKTNTKTTDECATELRQIHLNAAQFVPTLREFDINRDQFIPPIQSTPTTGTQKTETVEPAQTSEKMSNEEIKKGVIKRLTAQIEPPMLSESESTKKAYEAIQEQIKTLISPQSTPLETWSNINIPPKQDGESLEQYYTTLKEKTLPSLLQNPTQTVQNQQAEKNALMLDTHIAIDKIRKINPNNQGEGKFLQGHIKALEDLQREIRESREPIEKIQKKFDTIQTSASVLVPDLITTHTTEYTKSLNQASQNNQSQIRTNIKNLELSLKKASVFSFKKKGTIKKQLAQLKTLLLQADEPTGVAQTDGKAFLPTQKTEQAKQRAHSQQEPNKPTLSIQKLNK